VKLDEINVTGFQGPLLTTNTTSAPAPSVMNTK
jgi:hypothetical protein